MAVQNAVTDLPEATEACDHTSAAWSPKVDVGRAARWRPQSCGKALGAINKSGVSAMEWRRRP